MSVAIVFLVPGLVLVAAALLERYRKAGPPAWLEQRTMQSVLVHVADNEDGKSIEGVLAAVAADGLVLRAARFIELDQPVPLSGELFIPASRVLFVQVVGAAGTQPARG